MRINQNIGALNAYRNLTNTQIDFNKSPREAVVGLPDQPGGRRRGRSRPVRGPAVAGLRSEGRRPQRPGRHLRRADGGRCAHRGALHPPAHARPRGPGRQHRFGRQHRPQRGPGRGHPALRGDHPDHHSTKFGVQALFDGNFGVQAAASTGSATAAATAGSWRLPSSTFTVSVGTLAAVTVSVTAGDVRHRYRPRRRRSTPRSRRATFSNGSSVSRYVTATVTVDAAGNFVTKLAANGDSAATAAADPRRRCGLPHQPWPRRPARSTRPVRVACSRSVRARRTRSTCRSGRCR